MVLRSLFDRCHTLTLYGVQNDCDRLVTGSTGQRFMQFLHIMAVHCAGVKAKGCEFRLKVAGIQDILCVAVQLPLVPVNQPYQIGQFLCCREHGSFPDLAFIDLTVAYQQEGTAVSSLKSVAQRQTDSC